MLMRRNAGINKQQMADWSQDIIEGDSITQGEDWAWLQHAPYQGGAMQQMLQFQSDLKQDSGNSDFTRGQTANGVVSAKAINALQESGSKIARLRTDTLNNGFRRIIEQVIWLMAEFYEDQRMIMITGRDGKVRELSMDAKRFFGHKGKGAVAPPPYIVQVEISQKNPDRIAAQNELFMQAFSMAAQSQQYFPLSTLFRLMNLEGKDRLMPVIEQNEQQGDILKQLQQQNEQLVEQLTQMQSENDNLRKGVTKLSQALAQTGASGFTQDPGSAPLKVNEAGGGPNTNAALLNNVRRGMIRPPAQQPTMGGMPGEMI